MSAWTIKRRVVLGFATVLTLVALLSAVSVYMLGRIRTESDFMASDALPGLTAMADIQSKVSDIHIMLLRAALAKTQDERKKFEAEIATQRDAVGKLMSDYNSTIHLAEDREMFRKLT